MPDILVVSRDADLLFRVEEGATRAGCRVKTCVDVSQGKDWLTVRKFDALVSDSSITLEEQQQIAGALWERAALAPFFVIDTENDPARREGRVRLFGAEPLSGPQAIERLERALGRLAAQRMAREPEPLKILVVEDLDAARDIICSYVEGLGFAKVQGDRSAAEALARLDKNNTAASCIITDIRMPDMDGKELITKLRSDQRFKHLPIIVLTAYGTADMLVDCLRAGASGFLIKPPKKSDLVRELARAQRIQREHVSARLVRPESVDDLRDLLAERGLV